MSMPGGPTPKDRFTSLDTLALVRELRALGAPRVDKVFDAGPGRWSLTLSVPGAGKRELLLVPGRYAALLATARLHGEELSPLARELRRLLSGAVLRSVAEPGGERYLEIAFSRSDEPGGLVLATEIFGTGNLVVAHGGSIAAVARPRGWAHRTVRVGSPYSRPPARPDPWSLGAAAIDAELRRSRNDLASTLAARLGLGGPVAEEVVIRGGWEGSAPAATVASLAPRLHEILAALADEIGDRPRGYLYRRGEVLVDATPYRSLRWGGTAEEEPRPTFSEAAEAFFPTTIATPPTAEETADSEQRKELERLQARQARAVVDLADAVRARREDADAILANYPKAEEALARADPDADGARAVEVELGGRAVPLLRGRTPRQSAQALYEEAKRLSDKLEGARAALKETEERQVRTVAAAPTRAVAPAGPVRRPLWFERYRWFVSSEGVIAIAGRDAATNDLIVRRNLKEGDVYVHADLHGAASVVVKRPEDGSPIGEPTLREAAQWAVAFSKAWRAGLAAATAFWAMPDQVSKAAASGEFVPKGAWVVHGTKHYVRDLPLELALGTIVYRGEERWTVAPESAVRARGELRVLLTPGEDRERSAREVELVRELGIPRPVLQTLLPAGGLTVRRP